MGKQEDHALLSPSGAERWINCPGSIALSSEIPARGDTVYTEEGTTAHALAQLKLQLQNKEITKRTYNSAHKRIEASEFYSGEMEEATDLYTEMVWERLAAAGKGAGLSIEQRLQLGKWAKGSFGTSDAVINGDDLLEVIDLKYGKGVRVHAENNPQLRLYALGAVDLFSSLFTIKTVRMTIIQPRLDHVSTEEMSLEDLTAWGDEVVKPAAAEALRSDAHTAAGEWCRWCPAKAICRKRAEANLELAKYEFKKPGTLSNDEIGEILVRSDELQRWAADVAAYALEQALAGEKFDGWKLVEGRAVRKWADDLKVAEALQAAGYDEALLYERKLYGITAMEKLVGKKKLTETLGDLIIKPAGKPVLVPETDKREEINTTEAAKADFAEGGEA